MADLTITEIDALISSCKTTLSNALTDPKPNYTIGGRTVNYADYIRTLREQLSALREMKAEIPSESVRDFHYDITDTGEDNTELEGDEDI